MSSSSEDYLQSSIRDNPIEDHEEPIIGRAREMDAVRKYLSRDDRVPLVVFVGPPGVGKSSLAQLVMRERRNQFPDFMAIVHGHSGFGPQKPSEQLRRIELSLGLRSRSSENSSMADRIEILRWLLIKRRGILLVEGVNDLSWLKSAVNYETQSLVLATSLGRVMNDEGLLRVRLGPLSPEDSLTLFRISADETLRDISDEKARQLITKLSGFPIAVKIAAKRINRDYTFDSLLRDLEQADDFPDSSARWVVLWMMNRLTERERKLFSRIASLPIEVLPLDLIVAVDKQPEARTRSLLDRLVGDGLIREIDVNFFSLHDLVRSIVRRQESVHLDSRAVEDEAFAWYHAEIQRRVGALESPRELVREEAERWFALQVGEIRSLIELAGRSEKWEVSRNLALGARSYAQRVGDISSALQQQEFALQAARRINSDHMVVGDLAVLGELLLAAGSTREAAVVFREAGQRYALDDGETDIAQLLRVAAGLAAAQDSEGAFEALEQGLARTHDGSRKASSARSAILTQMARLNVAKGDLAQATSLADQALRAASQAGVQHLVADAQLVNGYLDASKGRVDIAVERLSQALSIYTEDGDSAGKAVTLQQLGIVASQMQRTDIAVYRLSTSLSLWRQLGIKYRECEVQNALGATIARMGLLDDAASEFEQALEVARSTGSQNLVAITLYNMSQALSQQGSWGEAKKSLARAARESALANDFDTLTLVLIRLGRTNAKLGLWAEAIEAYRDVFPLARDSDDRSRLLAVADGLGESLAAVGQIEEAVDYYEIGLSRARQLENPLGEVRLLLGLTLAYVAGGKSDELRPLARRALHLLTQLGMDVEDGESLESDTAEWASLARRLYSQIDETALDGGDRVRPASF